MAKVIKHNIIYNSAPSTATLLPYDNRDSGLSATTVKSAIDELADEKADKTEVPDNLQDLDNVSISSATNGQVLKYNGSNWVNDDESTGSSSFADLTDVDLSNLQNGQVAKYNSTTQKWENANESGGSTVSVTQIQSTGAKIATISIDSVDTDLYAPNGGASSLNELTDVTITSATNGQVLTYDNGDWKNVDPASVPSALDDLTDVDITSVQDGQVIKYNSQSGKWENGDESGASALADLTDVDIKSPKDGQIIKYDSVDQKWINTTVENKIYGFHINSSESDPEDAVTYLADAVGMTPAFMDYTNNKFNWGSWKNAFFIPRPCMLNYDGTVAYYLDENDYSKKEDGTASDIANDGFTGNAMMEWGQNRQRIWYKVVPDTGDNTSASIYIASYRADDNFHAWNFYDKNNNLKEHFYTPIYNGSIDGSGRLRSISGKAYSSLCQSKTAAQEITAAELNNVGGDKGWYTEVYSDIILIQFLCYLVGKSLDVQTTFGNGRISQTGAASSMLGTGTMNDKGLFWGSNGTSNGVKIFGMENFWANQWRRYAGHYFVNYTNKYKLTRGTADGSTVSDYSTVDATGYLTGETSPSASGYYSKCKFSSSGGVFISSVSSGSSSSYYADYFYAITGTRYAVRGADCSVNKEAGFCIYCGSQSDSAWAFGASISYK